MRHATLIIVSQASQRFARRVVMNLEHLRNRAVGVLLVTAGEIPRDGHSESCEAIEDYGVAPPQLPGSEPSTERIIDVWIRAGLVKNDVAVVHRAND